MPVLSAGNLTPSLPCPRCGQPLKPPSDKSDSLVQCEHCGRPLRATRDNNGAYSVHEEPAAAPPSVASSPTHHDPGATLPPTPSARIAAAAAGVPEVFAQTPAPGRSARASTSFPALRCVRCKNPFRPSPEKIGGVVKCKRCQCRLRVIRDEAGAYSVYEDSAGSTVTTSATRPPQSIPGASGQGMISTVAFPAGPQPPTPAPAGAAPARQIHGRRLWIASLVGLLLVVAVGFGALYVFFPSQPGVVSLGKYGGIEVGSTGVKMVGVEYFKTSDGVRELLLAEPRDANPKIADLPDGAGDFDGRALERTVAQVSDYFDALAKLGAPPANIYVACSSGVLSPFQTDESRLRNRDRLAQAIREKTGKEPAFVEPHEEAKLAFQEIVPADEWADAVLIDVGGYNTMGGGYVRKNTFLDFNVRVGVSSFDKKVLKDKREGESFRDAAQRCLTTEVEKPLDADLAAVSELKDRKKVYFLGGVPWALATYTRPADFYAPSRLTANSYQRRFHAADLLAFNDMVCSSTPADIRANVKSQTAGKEKEVVEAVDENLDKIQKDVFKKADRLVSGAQILLAIDKAFAMNSGDKEVWIFRHGQVAWLLGYMKAQSGHAE